MTRINAGIKVQELTDPHLLAEAREIKRIPNQIKSGRYNLATQPKHFKLGTGHVAWFYDKQLYLKKRYIRLYNECLYRGFNVTDYTSAWEGIPEHLMNDWVPSNIDRQLLQERIAERIKNSKKKHKNSRYE